jgi:pimeloyl-ACP methyl ester carboxylesterase
MAHARLFKIDKCRFVGLAMLAALLVAPDVRARVAAQGNAITWETFELSLAGGRKEAAQVGRLTVPERRSRPSGATIELAIVRLRSTAASPGSPLIYLDGGPGGGGYTAAAIEEYADLFGRIRLTRDVILLSQRGTGLSRPQPACKGEGPLPDDFFATVETMTQALGDRARRCVAQLRERKIDLTAYNTQESADDVEDLRKALGAERVGLFGFSYGTHLALSVLRRWPASVDRVVLAGVEGPDDTWKFPRTMEAQLQRLSEAAGGDVVSAWTQLIASSTQAPLQVSVRIGNDQRTLLIGAAGLQYLLRRDVGDTNDWPYLPAAITQASRGDFTLLGRLAGRRFAGFSSGLNLMPIAIDCASAASAARLKGIAAQEPSPLFGVMTNFPFPIACALLDLPMLPDAFREPLRSAVPTLFISGALDSNTPPSQAEAVAAGFTTAVHLVVENAGHESTLVADVRSGIVRFLRGEVVASGKVPAPPVKFAPGGLR